MIIQLKAYGDFDMQYTHSVWTNPTLDSFDVATLGDFRNERDPQVAVRALVEAGFRPMRTKSLVIGGNL